jgi:hypothetical protein
MACSSKANRASGSWSRTFVSSTYVFVIGLSPFFVHGMVRQPEDSGAKTPVAFLRDKEAGGATLSKTDRAKVLFVVIGACFGRVEEDGNVPG